VLGVSPKYPYQTVEALVKAKGLRAGGHGKAGAMTVQTLITMDLMGLEGRMIPGYKGSSAISLAMGKGEAHLSRFGDMSGKKYVDAGLVVPILSISEEHSPLFPDLPLFKDFFKVPPGKELLYAMNMNAQPKLIAVSGNVPEERVAFLRIIFKKMGKEKGVRRAIKRAYGVARPWVPVEKHQAHTRRVFADKQLKKELQRISAKYIP
jgi:tripartite-type tricarboxylate transporter receptor subunit TctC